MEQHAAQGSGPAPQRDEVVAYYDAFTARQQAAGINDRIVALYRRTRAAGLHPHSRILELGCGTGTLTRLLARHNAQGHIEAVDISPEAIRQATALGKPPNVRYQVGDVGEHRPGKDQRWDLITLFDVLEHIPRERHVTLFLNLASMSDAGTRILIHLPTAASIVHDRAHRPEALQIIDEALDIGYLAPLWSAAELEAVEFSLLSIWERDDYQWLVLRKALPHDPAPLVQQRGMFARLRRRLLHTWIHIQAR